ncbi:sugar phosphate isomerase/epimerase [Pararhizobium sp. BT-229]|uniref:sugar phosphate isomerase/epimerase family protein n=1 Tax=Pararhizobium sp. BT-229 TaxID=2986923 RepID=UPI0021F77D7C|nr:sugar phosphate isomerase/epimerase [Pararhizobium sp. BT-229]MCV9961672.1 sugar phosphate isomerase/epimerase [Pararhizobium sp. BT-229]
MSGFEPALCTVTFRSLAPPQIVRLATEANFAAIEWAGDVHVMPGDDQAARTVGELSRTAELATSFGSYVSPPTDDIDAFAKALETAVTLGASNMRIWPGTRQRDSADYSKAERRAVAESIREMAAEAARLGVTISLEYHPQSLTDTTDSAERLIDAIGHDNVYLYWQPRPGLPIEEALAEIARIGRHVSHVHVFAWDRERNRFPLKTASDYWCSVLAALPASRWKGRRFAMLEFVRADEQTAFFEDAATLHRILDAQAG